MIVPLCTFFGHPGGPASLEELEKKVGIPRKWLVYFLAPVLVVGLCRSELCFTRCFTVWVAIGIFYAYYTLRFRDHKRLGRRASLLWYAGYIAELVLIGGIVYHTGGSQSTFILLYPVTMVGVAASRPRANDLVLTGMFGHVSYTIALYLYYGNLNFYFSLDFWTQCLLIALTFAGVYMVLRLLEESLASLRETANQLAAKTRRLEELAVSDELTGLYNYKYFHQRLEEEMERAVAGGRPLSLLMLDVDNFRLFNERFGYAAGDKALVAIASILMRESRNRDVVCRFSGEEFCVIMPETDREEAMEVARRMVASVNTHAFGPFNENGEAYAHLSLSAGLACYPGDAASAAELLSHADSALCAAKQVAGEGIQSYCSLLEELRQAGVEEEEKFWTSLKTLITVIDARDRYTRGHSERVARYAMALAEKIGLPPEDCRLMGYAGFLHDIGKIEIEKTILNKEGPLSDEEWQRVRQHPVYGVAIVEPIERFKTLLPIIRHHHERYDGSGYPDHLKAETIPLGARILALADSYDAMRTNRPYRRGLSPAEARAEIKRCAGTQFDPFLAKQFLELLEAKGEELGDVVPSSAS